MFSTYYDDEERKKHLKIEKQIKKDEEMTRIDSFKHGANKLFRLKKQVQARAFSIKCFKYIRNILFVLGALFAASFFDIPIIENEQDILLLVLNLVVPFFILTFVLYCLSLLYFPLCKAIYYLIHKNDDIPYISSGDIARDTKKMYDDAVKIHKEASSLWHDWWHALYVKRSRVLKIATALSCVIVVSLNGYFNANSNVYIILKKFNVFTGKMSNENIISLCACILGLGLALYFILWLVFYYSDRMILVTQLRNSAVWKCKKFEDKFYEYWRNNDPVENKKYWDIINKHAQERELNERLRTPHNSYNNTVSSTPDYIIMPHYDVSDM